MVFEIPTADTLGQRLGRFSSCGCTKPATSTSCIQPVPAPPCSRSSLLDRLHFIGVMLGALKMDAVFEIQAQKMFDTRLQ